MAYIAPNSTIQLFKNLPLNPDYENTYYFHKREDDYQETGQNNFFGERAVATFTANSYVRKEKGVIKLQAPYASVYDCCYMRYRNTNFEYKWFYAFILKVEYINNETVEITFQIDVMQTWLPYVDYDFEECFIEREHTADDEYFHNLESEDIDTSQYQIQESVAHYSLYDPSAADNLNVAFIASRTERGETPYSSKVWDIFMPLYAVGTDAATARAFITAYYDQTAGTPYSNSSPEDIIAVYMYPSKFGTFMIGLTSQPSYQAALNDEWQPFPNLTTIDGYTPYNRKLFQYPYKWLNVTNNNGRSANYKWEDWAIGKTWNNRDELMGLLGRFIITGCALPPVTSLCYPREYQLKQNDYDAGLIIDNFPQCAWAGDTYKAWWAQNKASVTTGLIAGAVSAAAGIGVSGSMPFITPAVMGALTMQTVVSQGAQVAQLLAKKEDLQRTPPQVHGQNNTEMLSAVLGKYKYTARRMCISSSIAQRIDMYFQMYGYKSNKIKKPYMHHRQKWWYTKTVGCDINGSLPADDIKEICKIFDKGIRFWWDKGRIGTFDTANITRTPDFPI